MTLSKLTNRTNFSDESIKQLAAAVVVEKTEELESAITDASEDFLKNGYTKDQLTDKVEFTVDYDFGYIKRLAVKYEVTVSSPEGISKTLKLSGFSFIIDYSGKTVYSPAVNKVIMEINEESKEIEKKAFERNGEIVSENIEAFKDFAANKETKIIVNLKDGHPKYKTVKPDRTKSGDTGFTPQQLDTTIKDALRLMEQYGIAINNTLEESVKAEVERRYEQEKEEKRELAERKEKGKAELLAWSKENGSELLQGRIDENLNWVSLAQREYCEDILRSFDLGFLSDIDAEIEIIFWENADLETIRKVKELRAKMNEHPAFVDIRPTLLKYYNTEEDYYNEEDYQEQTPAVEITLKTPDLNKLAYQVIV